MKMQSRGVSASCRSAQALAARCPHLVASSTGSRHSRRAAVLVLAAHRDSTKQREELQRWRPEESQADGVDCVEQEHQERWQMASQASTRGQTPLEAASTLMLSVGGAALLAAPAAFGALPSSASQPLFVAQALGVLTAIVAVHEAGHFAAARLQGIHVTKFAIGFGPALFSFKGGEVEYSLRAIPLGGYVAFPDDDPASPYPADDPDLLRNRGIASRAAVISAGVVANIIFAYTALMVQVSTVGKAESAYLPGVSIPSLDQWSAGAASGLRSGDVVTRVGGYQLTAGSDQVSKVVNLIKASPGQALEFEVKRQGATAPELVAVVPERSPATGQGRIGVSLAPVTYIRHVKGSSVNQNFAIVNAEFYRLLSTVLGGLKAIVTNFAGVAGQVSGPVAIVAAGADIAKTDAAGLFQFCAIVNINLAVVNLLPLPALDGGYLLLLAVEAARGKKLPEKVEQGFMASGFLLLMAMGLSLVVKDTINLLPL